MIDRGYGNSRLRYEIENPSCAFKALAEKLGRRLSFCILSRIPDRRSKRYKGFDEDLEPLLTLVRDGKSNVESEGWELEEDEA